MPGLHRRDQMCKLDHRTSLLRRLQSWSERDELSIRNGSQMCSNSFRSTMPDALVTLVAAQAEDADPDARTQGGRKHAPVVLREGKPAALTNQEIDA